MTTDKINQVIYLPVGQLSFENRHARLKLITELQRIWIALRFTNSLFKMYFLSHSAAGPGTL
jgi:hypothetical protein